MRPCSTTSPWTDRWPPNGSWLEIKRACEGLCWFPMIGRQLDPEDSRVRVLTVRRRAAIKFLVLEEAVHILGISYWGRDLAAFFAGRLP